MLPCPIIEGGNMIGNIAFGKPTQSCSPPKKEVSSLKTCQNTKCHVNFFHLKFAFDMNKQDQLIQRILQKILQTVFSI